MKNFNPADTRDGVCGILSLTSHKQLGHGDGTSVYSLIRKTGGAEHCKASALTTVP